MSNISLQFLGCGDAFGSGGRFNTSFHVKSSTQNFLIDCGASSLIAMKRLGINPSDIDLILITHLHGDHFGGLPFFILDANYDSQRSRPLTIAGPSGFEAKVWEAMDALYPGSSSKEFKFQLQFIDLEEHKINVINSLNVRSIPVMHSEKANAHALKIEVEGKTIAYSGDTAWTESLIEVAKAADIFICECYFYEKDVKGHLNYQTILNNKPRLECKKIILTHLGPEMLSRLDEIELECAEDGKIITV